MIGENIWSFNYEDNIDIPQIYPDIKDLDNLSLVNIAGNQNLMEKANFGMEKADFGMEKADFGMEKADFDIENESDEKDFCPMLQGPCPYKGKREEMFENNYFNQNIPVMMNPWIDSKNITY